ncbi:MULTISPECIES: hypothetical protein [Trichocoleus]|uniref:Uncharacterized protein n=1 Tax=Trichocoleus desertorum GB2-A4 TaxID=2933944 RepID=A0ABV0JCW0_9CYAN|nr:hypothetical protein [Trichocoleus sp. FACHB-46]MBD1864265.1 hypothetical protein [Trichocoleus sp. FACHB-46]
MVKAETKPTKTTTAAGVQVSRSASRKRVRMSRKYVPTPKQVLLVHPDAFKASRLCVVTASGAFAVVVFMPLVQWVAAPFCLLFLAAGFMFAHLGE